jgi:hypothetical protein
MFTVSHHQLLMGQYTLTVKGCKPGFEVPREAIR